MPYKEAVIPYLDAVVTLAIFFFSSRRRHTRCGRDWSSDVCSSDLAVGVYRWVSRCHRHANCCHLGAGRHDTAPSNPATASTTTGRRPLSLAAVGTAHTNCCHYRCGLFVLRLGRTPAQPHHPWGHVVCCHFTVCPRFSWHPVLAWR